MALAQRALSEVRELKAVSERDREYDERWKEDTKQFLVRAQQTYETGYGDMKRLFERFTTEHEAKDDRRFAAIDSSLAGTGRSMLQARTGGRVVLYIVIGLGYVLNLAVSAIAAFASMHH